MYSKNKIIKTFRGDSQTIYIDVPAWVEDGDIFYLAITLPHQLFEDACIVRRIKYTSDLGAKLQVRLTSAETASLCPGVYYYEIKVLNSKEVFSTVQLKTKLVILKDVKI